jgi:hypothetical protein
LRKHILPAHEIVQAFSSRWRHLRSSSRSVAATKKTMSPGKGCANWLPSPGLTPQRSDDHRLAMPFEGRPPAMKPVHAA